MINLDVRVKTGSLDELAHHLHKMTKAIKDKKVIKRMVKAGDKRFVQIEKMVFRTEGRTTAHGHWKPYQPQEMKWAKWIAKKAHGHKKLLQAPGDPRLMKSLTKRDHPLHVARYKHGHFEYGTKDPRAAAMQFGGIISRKWRRKGYSILFPARRVIDMTRLQQREMFFALYNELNNHFVNLAFKAGFRIPYHNRPTV